MTCMGCTCLQEAQNLAMKIDFVGNCSSKQLQYKWYIVLHIREKKTVLQQLVLATLHQPVTPKSLSWWEKGRISLIVQQLGSVQLYKGTSVQDLNNPEPPTLWSYQKIKCSFCNQDESTAYLFSRSLFWRIIWFTLALKQSRNVVDGLLGVKHKRTFVGSPALIWAI
jgi:hypothetical protein